MKKEAYNRMVSELKQLDDRIDRLEDFTLTKNYLALSLPEKTWINEQLNAMKWYYSALKNRVLFYHDQEVNASNADKQNPD